MKAIEVKEHSEYPENPSIGDFLIRRYHMHGYGVVFEVQKYEAVGVVTNNCYWTNQTLEPFNSVESAQKYIDEMK